MNTKKQIKQNGLWKSQISPVYISKRNTLADVQISNEGEIVWLEKRSGQGILAVRSPGDQTYREINSDQFVQARVGYGGGDFSIGNGNAYFAEKLSGRLFKQSLACGPATAISPEFGKAASPTLSPDGKWLVFVRSYEGQDALEIVDAASQHWPKKIVSGKDFYMQPAWHPEGKKLAWISWNHPNMPWDGTNLVIGDVEYHDDCLPVVTRLKEISGGESISVFQPEFSPDGRFLTYISDKSGWWQIYLYDLELGTHTQLTDETAEYGLPAWIQGLRTYGFCSDSSHLFALRNTEGYSSLRRIDITTGENLEVEIDDEYKVYSQISVGQDVLCLIASGPGVSERILRVPISKIEMKNQVLYAKAEVIRRASSESIQPEVYSIPEPIQWTGADGNMVFGLYYPPHNPGFEGSGTAPLIVYVHGGPTGQTRPDNFLMGQFFTSRGYAVLAVNYRGSAGYGREYRDMLKKSWGIYDVQDSISGAEYLFQKGYADPEKAVIMGGSAGGFTVLQALVDHPGFFAAGICLYGVSNQFTLADETHKFEAHYSDSLLGSLPEAVEFYREKSPIYHIDQIKDPMLVFQGEDDIVVPRNQMDEVVKKLEGNGIPVEYHLYAGEGHGFRKSETLVHFFTAVDKFLKQTVIFK